MKSSLPPDGAPIEHFVSTEAFDPKSVEKLSPIQERIYLASQLRLMWWKF
jgi:peptide/nickel transport system permease protein